MIVLLQTQSFLAILFFLRFIYNIKFIEFFLLFKMHSSLFTDLFNAYSFLLVT